MENNNKQRSENSPKTARTVAMLVASASATTIFTVAISPITVTNAKKTPPTRVSNQCPKYRFTIIHYIQHSLHTIFY